MQHTKVLIIFYLSLKLNMKYKLQKKNVLEMEKFGSLWFWEPLTSVHLENITPALPLIRQEP